VEACARAGDDVVALSREQIGERGDGIRWVAADLADAAAARQVVRTVAPQRVFHLAAVALVPASWADPAGTLRANTETTLNLLEAVRREAPEARVVIASSGEVYGPPVRLPVDEDAPLRPQNPYAVSKAAADLLSGFYADAHGVHVVRARAFNHAGPGQVPAYAIASFARQLAEALVAGRDRARIVSGNPESRRDYTDVRDVVRAYRLLGELVVPGAYNVCTGVSTSVREVIALLGQAAGLEIDHDVDERLMRPHDVLEVCGSRDRLTSATNWSPEIPLARTLADTVAWWRERLAG